MDSMAFQISLLVPVVCKRAKMNIVEIGRPGERWAEPGLVGGGCRGLYLLLMMCVGFHIDWCYWEAPVASFDHP